MELPESVNDLHKVLRSYEEYGNTSTATLPFTICNNVDEIKRRNGFVFFCVATVLDWHGQMLFWIWIRSIFIRLKKPTFSMKIDRR